MVTMMMMVMMMSAGLFDLMFEARSSILLSITISIMVIMKAMAMVNIRGS